MNESGQNNKKEILLKFIANFLNTIVIPLITHFSLLYKRSGLSELIDKNECRITIKPLNLYEHFPTSNLDELLDKKYIQEISKTISEVEFTIRYLNIFPYTVQIIAGNFSRTDTKKVLIEIKDSNLGQILWGSKIFLSPISLIRNNEGEYCEYINTGSDKTLGFDERFTISIKVVDMPLDEYN